MFRKLGPKRYLAGFQDGTTAGYELALTRIEAMLHSELKKLAQSKFEENKEVRVKELVWVLSKVKGFYRVAK